METQTLTKPTTTKYRQITETSLQIIDTIYRYRFITTSQVLRLLPTYWRTLYHHLKSLVESHRLIERLPLVDLKTGQTEEYVYFLSNNKPLRLLVETGFREPEELDFERYSHGQKDVGIGRLLFIRHELMISRLRGMIEQACQESNGEVELSEFRQGAELKSFVDAPSLPPGEGSERLPLIPDAFFTLYFPHRPEGQQYASFAYEADRKTMDTTKRMRMKLRAYFHYIVKQKKHHQPPLNARHIRAVLIESVDSNWADKLRKEAMHPAISGAKPSNLFWFTPSKFFTKEALITEQGKPKVVQESQANPGVIFNPIWFSPNDRAGDRPRSLLDP